MDKLEKDEDEFVLDDSKDDLEAEVTVEDEGPEFSHFEDDEEFVGYNDKDDAEEFMNEKKPTRSAKASQPLQYANVPLHLRSNWENYYVEILMVLGMQINMAFGIIGTGTGTGTHLHISSYRYLSNEGY